MARIFTTRILSRFTCGEPLSPHDTRLHAADALIRSERIVVAVAVHVLHGVHVRVMSVVLQQIENTERVRLLESVVFEQRARSHVGNGRALIGDDQPVLDAQLFQAGKNGREHPPRAYGEHAARRAVGGNGVLVGLGNCTVGTDERAVKIGEKNTILHNSSK